MHPNPVVCHIIKSLLAALSVSFEAGLLALIWSVDGWCGLPSHAHVSRRVHNFSELEINRTHTRSSRARRDEHRSVDHLHLQGDAEEKGLHCYHAVPF